MANVSSHATRKVVHALNNRDAATEVISKIDTAGVMSVFGRSGTVVATSGDYTAAQVTNAVDSTATYSDPAWLTSLAGSKVSGDILGDASSITGSISESQVTGLTTDLAAKAADASVVHIAGIETVTGAKTFSAALTSVVGLDVTGPVDFGSGLLNPNAENSLVNFTVPRKEDPGFFFFMDWFDRFCHIDKLADSLTVSPAPTFSTTGSNAALFLDDSNYLHWDTGGSMPIVITVSTDTNPIVPINNATFCIGLTYRYSVPTGTLTVGIEIYDSLTTSWVAVSGSPFSCTLAPGGCWISPRFLSLSDDSYSIHGVRVTLNGTNSAGINLQRLMLIGHGPDQVDPWHLNVGGGELSSRNRMYGTLILHDGVNVQSGTSTGTAIGTSTSQKLGFFGATPVVRQTGDVITGLSNLGLVTSGTISEADVTGLVTDLGAKAPLASPTFTGNVATSGALSLTGTGQVAYTTPGSASVNTKINVPLFDPGAYGAIMYMGVPSTAAATSRVFLCFDGRTTAHQQTFGVCSVDEGDIIGLSWDGNNSGSSGYIKTLGSPLVLRIDTLDAVSCHSSGGAPQVGFLGASPVLRQTGGAATAGGSYTSTEQGMINAMYTALRNYGLLT